MAKHYEYLTGGVIYGPVTGKEIHRRAAAGQMSPDDLIRQVDGDRRGNWVRAGTVKSLHFGPPPVAAAAPLVPSLPETTATAPGPVEPFAAIVSAAELADPPRFSDPRRRTRNATEEYALGILYGLLALMWGAPVGYAGAYLIAGGRNEDKALLFLWVGAGALLIQFASILISSIRVRIWVALLLFFAPFLTCLIAN